MGVCMWVSRLRENENMEQTRTHIHMDRYESGGILKIHP